MTFDKKNDGQRQSGPSDVVLPVGLREDEPKELYGETDPKEEVELDEAQENLIAGVHFLDATIGTKELVYLPPKLVVDFPPKGNISYLGCGNDYWNDVRKGVN